MSRSKTMTAIAAGLVALGIGGTALASDRSGEEASEATLALSAPHSLLDAVKTAEQAAAGIAYEASIEGEKSQTLYVISTAAGGKTTQIAVDPQTGKVMAQEQPGMLSRLMGEDDDGAGQAKVRLADAIGAAEEAAGGKAMEAEFEDDGDEAMKGAAGPHWAVLVAGQDGARTMVAVDAQSGAVLASVPATGDDD